MKGSRRIERIFIEENLATDGPAVNHTVAVGEKLNPLAHMGVVKAVKLRAGAVVGLDGESGGLHLD